MKIHLIFFISFLGFGACHQKAEILERYQILDTILSVRWTVEFPSKRVTFTLTALSRDSIGFGIVDKKTQRADVIVGGIAKDGTPYFTDRFGNGTEEPIIDDQSDWVLYEANANETHTTLKFQRSFDTCDHQDLPFTDDTTHFIWSIGEPKILQEWSMTPVLILDPHSGPPDDTSEYDIWEFTRTTTLTGGTDTTEWCTIHKTKNSTAKQHIIGYKMMMDTPEARKHIHHVNINRCITKPGSPAREALERFVGHPGGTCFLRTADPDLIQSVFLYCPETIYFWAKGGEPLFLPQIVGTGLNGDGLEEYFIFQVHYHNPQMAPDITVETGIQMFTTPMLREQESGLLFTGDSTDTSVVVPPNTPKYVIAGHCSFNCTGMYLPPGGIHVFNAMMHTHNAGVQMKVRHFRPQMDGTVIELPWISHDDNFDNNWQQTRGLKDTVHVLPGDQITVECTYDNTYKNPPAVTIGGGGAESEMCRTYLMYYPRMDKLGACVSQYPLDKLLQKFGIEEMDMTNYEDPTVLAPVEMANKTYSTVLNTMINWTPQFREELQHATRYVDDHFDYCLELPIWDTKSTRADPLPPMTNYPPNYELYVPPMECAP